MFTLDSFSLFIHLSLMLFSFLSFSLCVFFPLCSCRWSGREPHSQWRCACCVYEQWGKSSTGGCTVCACPCTVGWVVLRCTGPTWGSSSGRASRNLWNIMAESGIWSYSLTRTSMWWENTQTGASNTINTASVNLKLRSLSPCCNFN